MNRLVAMLIPLLLLGPAHAAPDPAPKDSKAEGPSVTCTVRSILGLERPGGIDKRLAFLRGQLTKPPFSVYKTMNLLEAKDVAVPQAATRQLTLPNNKVLALTFKERLLGRKDRLRLRLHLSITSPKEPGKTKDVSFLRGTLFTIENRGTLLVAGDKHQNGTLVVGITCQTQ